MWEKAPPVFTFRQQQRVDATSPFAVVESKSQLSFYTSSIEAYFRACKSRAKMANAASHHPTAHQGDRSIASARVNSKDGGAGKLLLGKDAVKLSSDWGPASMNLTLDTVDIFASNYNIFEPEVRRGFFYALFFTRGLHGQGIGKSSKTTTNSNVVDTVVELGVKDQDQWVQAISKAIKSRKEKENEESVSVVDVSAFVESVPVVSDALKSIREKLKSLLEKKKKTNSDEDEDAFATFNVYAPLESSYLNCSRTSTRGGNSNQTTTSTTNKHFTLKKLEKPRRKSYLEVSAKRVNRFGDVISNVDSSTTGATTTGTTAIVSKSLESSFQQQQQQMKPKSSFLLDTKKRTISSHGYQVSGTKRTFENRDGSAKDMEKEKEIRLQRLKLIKEKEAERKRVAEEEMKKRRENYKASVEAKKRALDIQEKSKTTIISTPSPSDRT